jgi:hypothetical protein
MKVVDVHVHIFPDEVADAYIRNYSEHSGFQARCGPTLKDLYQSYEGLEVVNFVILQQWQTSVPFESEHLKYVGEFDGYYTKYYFYSFHPWLGKIQAENERLLCFGAPHPDEPDCEEEFERVVNDYGLKGIKLHPCMQMFFLNDRRLFPIYERAEALGLPVLAHTGGDPIQGMELYGHPRDLDEVATAFPKLKLIIAHFGIPFFDEATELMGKHENVFADISFTLEVIDPEQLSSLIRKVGVDRVMFGSDYPFIEPKAAIQNVLELNLSDEDKERILWKNAVEILKED